MMEVSAHKVTELYIRQKSSNETSWVELLAVSDDGKEIELTLYAKSGEPIRLYFGEPE